MKISRWGNSGEMEEVVNAPWTHCQLEILAEYKNDVLRFEPRPAATNPFGLGFYIKGSYLIIGHIYNI